MVSKKISVLGSTGSIGRSVDDVVQRSGGSISVVGLAAGRNVELLAEQIERFSPEKVAVFSEDLVERLSRLISHLPSQPEILWGKDGYKAVASMDQADLVVSAMVGAAGLVPTLAAIKAGKDVALANKETLVAAGPLVMRMVRERGIKLLPIDSEHSAIFQCMHGYGADQVKRIILTASGGPFREISREDMVQVTPQQAVAHPNWSMGAKISVDSSTLMNKGLEVIEARWLFDIPPEQIDVAIHPQSIVHSMVEFVDGSILAQMGIPDMRGPISHALFWPERLEMDLPSLDLFTAGNLSFEPPDLRRFPCLGLAYRALDLGGTACTILNAANEVAVEAFLQGRIPYLSIPEVIDFVLSDMSPQPMENLDQVLQDDATARLKADDYVYRLEAAK